MSSIGHDGQERQLCGCRWYFNAADHHDVWLRKLSRLQDQDITSLVRENEEQSRCSALPRNIIPLIDIHDFTMEHREDLSDEAVVISKTLRYLAGRAMIPLKALHFEIALDDAKAGGV